MEHILMVSGSETAAHTLTEMLTAAGFCCIDTAASGSEARRRLIDGEIDYLVVNAPLPDEFGTELCIDVSEGSDCGILLIVKSEMADAIQEKVEEFGIFVIPKPVNRQVLYQSFKFVEASRRRIAAMKEKNKQLENRIEDLRLIDRAKCYMIEKLGMTEQQAHRFIEKQAMDSRKPRRDIARDILEEKQP